MAKQLGITWKLHTAYHPQSSRKVECMSRVLKLQGVENYARRTTYNGINYCP
jgi:hypothetical protein